jgi:predicted HicB family RNase H-like nuclease
MIPSVTATIYARIPPKLHARILKAAQATDLKIVAIVRQALELWLKENGG